MILKADIEPQRTPKGRVKAGKYDVRLTGYADGSLQYISLSSEELEGIMELIRRLGR
jgi:hypothetical protein